MTNNGFLPADYEAPKSGGNFTKLQKGENKLRILSKPVLGWLDWENKTPHRFPYKEKPAAPFDPKQAVKHFWAMVVWNYNDCAIQILEITQSGIQKAIAEYAKNEDWGDPFAYDIKITKKGAGLETEYVVTPVPHKELSQEAKSAFQAKKVNLNALFTNDDPFEIVESETKGDDLPF